MRPVAVGVAPCNVSCCLSSCVLLSSPGAVLLVSSFAVFFGAVPRSVLQFVLSCAVLRCCVPRFFCGRCVVPWCAMLLGVAPCLVVLRCSPCLVCYPASVGTVCPCFDVCFALRFCVALPVAVAVRFALVVFCCGLLSVVLLATLVVRFAVYLEFVISFFLRCACFVVRCFAWCCVWHPFAICDAPCCGGLLLGLVPSVWAPCNAFVAVLWWLVLCLGPIVSVPDWVLCR